MQNEKQTKTECTHRAGTIPSTAKFRAAESPIEILSYVSIGEAMTEFSTLATPEDGGCSTSMTSLVTRHSTRATRHKHTELVTPSLIDMTLWRSVPSLYRTYAARKVAEVVRCVHGQGSEAALADMLKPTSVCDQPSHCSGHILFHLDLNLGGESKMSHLQTAPFRKDQIARLINTGLNVWYTSKDASSHKIPVVDVRI